MAEERTKDINPLDDMERRFTYHPPDDVQATKYRMIRHEAYELSLTLLKNCPDSREKSLAITKLEECVMWANAAVARNK